eukprot:scaffold1535_cov382-Prasinococcus_capsulatus_cf.AAC.41
MHGCAKTSGPVVNIWKNIYGLPEQRRAVVDSDSSPWLCWMGAPQCRALSGTAAVAAGGRRPRLAVVST